MSSILAELSTEHRLDLEARLARYGLQGDMHVSGSLSVPERGQLTLSRYTNDPGTHIVLRTDDLDQVKAWVGVPNGAFASPDPTSPLPHGFVDQGKRAEDVTLEEWQTLYDAGRAYIWGPSSLVAEYRPALEQLVGPFEVVVHIYLTLDVRGELSFDDGDQAVVVLANTINFHPGGYIDSADTNLSVSATNIFQVQP